MPCRPLTPEQLASIREAVVRGQRELEAFIRGEGPAPGFFQSPSTMAVDPVSAPAQPTRKPPRDRA